MRSLDADIRRALERPPDIARLRSAGPPPAWRQWALAASVVLASLAVCAVWLLRPSDTLAHEVVAHVQEEPRSWLATQHVSAQGIAHALRAPASHSTSPRTGSGTRRAAGCAGITCRTW